MTRPFKFNSEKAIQAVAFLLRRERGHRMNYMRLLKVLYFAEREILAESGKPLTGSRVLAMQRGPVLEDIFQVIHGSHNAVARWSSFLQVDRYQLEMITDPGAGLLSRFVTRKLEEVATRYDALDEWAMVEETHKLPEWQKNDPGGSSREIPLADILEAVGRSADLDEIVAHAREDEQAGEFFCAIPEQRRAKPVKALNSSSASPVSFSPSPARLPLCRPVALRVGLRRRKRRKQFARFIYGRDRLAGRVTSKAAGAVLYSSLCESVNAPVGSKECRCAMRQVVIENPIINSPFEEPARHFRFDDEGITNEIVTQRRVSCYFIPIAQPKKKPGQKQLAFDDWNQTRVEENKTINEIRRLVKTWREGRYTADVTRVTARLLEYWRRSERDRRLFFCQIEALETAIYIDGGRQEITATPGSKTRCGKINEDANPGLFRIACKMATGSGKTVGHGHAHRLAHAQQAGQPAGRPLHRLLSHRDARHHHPRPPARASAERPEQLLPRSSTSSLRT